MRRRIPIGIATILGLLVLSTVVPVFGQIEIETVLEGLNNPVAVAIQPGTDAIFVSDSGAGRVVRIDDGIVRDVIVGFPVEDYGKGPAFKIGPLGLAFIDSETLVVGGGGRPDNDDYVRVYSVSEQADALPINALDMETMLGSVSLPAEGETSAEGNFYGLAISRELTTEKPIALYVTCNGDDDKGWVGQATIEQRELTNFRRFIPTKEFLQSNAPTAITVSPRGEILIGQMGSIDEPEDSQIAFFNSNTGDLLASFETELNDIIGIAYSPKAYNIRGESQLYVLDFRWPGDQPGGLHHIFSVRLTGGKQGVQSNRVVELDKPTAMAFASDGSLYITLLGTSNDGQSEPAGKLLRIAPGL